MLEITHVRSAASPSPHLRLGMNISPGLSEQSGTTGQAGIASRGLTKQGVILLYITSPRLLEQSGTPEQAGIASRGLTKQVLILLNLRGKLSLIRCGYS